MTDDKRLAKMLSNKKSIFIKMIVENINSSQKLPETISSLDWKQLVRDYGRLSPMDPKAMKLANQIYKITGYTIGSLEENTIIHDGDQLKRKAARKKLYDYYKSLCNEKKKFDDFMKNDLHTVYEKETDNNGNHRYVYYNCENKKKEKDKRSKINPKEYEKRYKAYYPSSPLPYYIEKSKKNIEMQDAGSKSISKTLNASQLKELYRRFFSKPPNDILPKTPDDFNTNTREAAENIRNNYNEKITQAKKNLWEQYDNIFKTYYDTLEEYRKEVKNHDIRLRQEQEQNGANKTKSSINRNKIKGRRKSVVFDLPPEQKLSEIKPSINKNDKEVPGRRRKSIDASDFLFSTQRNNENLMSTPKVEPDRSLDDIFVTTRSAKRRKK